MSFLQPLALLGLLTLPVILLLHLLRERSKRTVVPSLELWRWLEKEVRGPRFKRIPFSWILLLQLLAAALLTLALMQPELLNQAATSRGQRLIIVLDTSASMSAVDIVPSRISQAQTRAAGLLALLGDNDSVALITAGPSARLQSDSAQAGLASLTAELAAVRASGVGSDWEGALALASAAVLPERVNRMVVFTDGASRWPEHLDSLRLPARVEWYVLGTPQSNQAVLGLSARPAASGAIQVFAQIANFGNGPARRDVALLADGAVLDRSTVELAPSGVLAQAWSLPPGVSTVAVQLSGDDVLPADDSAWVGVSGGRPVNALLVSERPAALERVLRSLPYMQLTVAAPGDYAARERYDLTVLHNWLPDAWPEGGVLVVSPPVGSSLLPVIGSVPVGQLELSRPDPLLADVDLGPVRFESASSLAPSDWLVPVLSNQAGEGLIWRGATGDSRVVVVGMRLENSDIERRAACPVLMANVAAELLPPPLPASLTPGSEIVLPSAQLFPRLRVTTPGGDVVDFDEDRAAVFAGTFQPGLYVLQGQSATGEAWQAGVGINTGDAHESELRHTARPAFADDTEANFNAGPPQPFKLWPLAVFFVLALMLIEARLAWR